MGVHQLRNDTLQTSYFLQRKTKDEEMEEKVFDFASEINNKSKKL